MKSLWVISSSGHISVLKIFSCTKFFHKAKKSSGLNNEVLTKMKVLVFQFIQNVVLRKQKRFYSISEMC